VDIEKEKVFVYCFSE